MAEPKIGTLLDRLYRTKLKKEEMEERLRTIKAEYDSIEKQIFDAFGNADIDRAGGRLATASLSNVVYPSLKDYDAFAAFVYRNKALDLLQRRVAKGNWQNRLEARKGRPIPGVETFEQVKLNLRKRT